VGFEGQVGRLGKLKAVEWSMYFPASRVSFVGTSII
jgi:hypothetical protein